MTKTILAEAVTRRSAVQKMTVALDDFTTGRDLPRRTGLGRVVTD